MPTLVRHAETPRRIRGQPLRDAFECEAALTVSLFQQDRQSSLNTRDTAPDLEEIVAGFHFGRCGRMVRAYDPDAAVQHTLP
jgi:hypothetical protein